ncbi:MAG: hypothetical protein CMH32_00620 [Micavibrio sp.]|nr:hypothetical protein [Micavibrio sp.]
MLKNKLLAYITCSSGAVAAVFGFLLPVIVGSAGMAVDLSKAYLVKNRMCLALDASTLAVGSSSGSIEELEDKLQAFMNANYPEDEFGHLRTPQLEVTENLIHAEVSADVDTSFMGLLGNETMRVDCSTDVVREVRGLEVALVVDVTGSMSTNNNIDALRTASRNFVNILYDRTTDEENVKIGIVPYVANVNVGPYGLGLDEAGQPYGDAFVRNPSGLSFDQSEKFEWHGCVMARENPDDTLDAQDTWQWDMFRHDFSRSRNSSYRYYASYYNNNYGPNYDCNRNHIQPLTSDRTTLLEKIDLFYPGGYTHGNLGMVWGYRVISPGFPFEEGAAWEDDQWQKAILMMTDGVNTVPQTYGAYGGYLDYVDDGVDTTELNERFEATCNLLREEGVLVYTVTFTSGVDATTRGYYERCATDPSKYINAPEQADLIEAFERISTELSNLHISQ